ncbi:MAG: hypothetical protein VKP62_11725 [Candidatus Sericytochromatia bacterium]|nr:hypothetical protein [Candidatus Sericytochromatia bacterium]
MAVLPRSTPLLLMALVGLTACGLPPRADSPATVSPRLATRVRGLTKALPSLDRPVSACRVLAFAHQQALAFDEAARFQSLAGTHITALGVPGPGGHWTLRYLSAPSGSPSPSQAGASYRAITLRIHESGQAELEAAWLDGLPLGLALFDSPIPRIDSQSAIAHARTLRPTQPLDAHFRLTLAGSLNAHHFRELAWHVQTLRQDGLEPPVVFNASTGDSLR